MASIGASEEPPVWPRARALPTGGRTAAGASGSSWLLRLADVAHDALHVMAIYLMPLLRIAGSLELDRVVAEAAREELTAAGCPQLTAP